MSRKKKLPFGLWEKKTFYAFLIYTVPVKFTAKITHLIFASKTTPRSLWIKKLLMTDYNFLHPFLISSLYDTNIFLGVLIADVFILCKL